MDLLEICLFIGIAYLVIALIVFLADMLTEYLFQKQDEIIREHAKPTVMSVLSTVPYHLQKALFWWTAIKNIF